MRHICHCSGRDDQGFEMSGPEKPKKEKRTRPHPPNSRDRYIFTHIKPRDRYIFTHIKPQYHACHASHCQKHTMSAKMGILKTELVYRDTFVYAHVCHGKITHISFNIQTLVTRFLVAVMDCLISIDLHPQYLRILL